MDRTDRKILTLISNAFPLHERPFRHIAREVGITEEEALERVRRLKDTGLIRRIGAVISPGSLGWYSTLCAAEIPVDRIDDYTSLVNSYDEVTHNYVRSGHPNCWFTLITPNAARAREIIREIQDRLGTEILDLPAKRVFKINVSFDFAEEDASLP
ncbi:MAG: Lrp/AsnC family transcriptional regulator [Bacteriovoracaceae bacterium]|mgnify:FL=1|jgi:DNA-binding Lrp family transcriptional regulator|nr:Lrp/AsnC family transcriptional regulator [Bacteriovoracaceae bacterium]HRR21411.1 AsnC family transcriptional regulator [Desulfomonilia bacterium]HRR69751.1 AsnC family transcriptional regulator [Desulfomonilia bacterium]HRT45732.1 AsnC family transcriptional regulator [Desulfomonilia bacterium]